ETKIIHKKQSGKRRMAGLFFAFVLVFLGILTPSLNNPSVLAANTVSIKLQFKQTGSVKAAVFQYYATALVDGTPIPCASKTCGSGKYELHWNFDSKEQDAHYDNRNPIQFESSQGTIVKVVVKDLQANTSYTAQADRNKATATTTTPPVEETGKAAVDYVLDPFFGIINKVLQALAFGIIGFLYFVLNIIILPIIQVLLTIQPHDASFSAVILVGWVFVRNVANILFIIAMIILGMATLLRVEKYNYKHLIPELVLMAIAVNFSLVVAQLILGVADTFQAQFLPNNKDVLNALAHQLMVSPLQNISKDLFHGSFADLISTLVYFIFAVGTFFVFAAIAAFLVIRIVALWLLLMLSPIAYVGMILPDTHHEAMKWWSNFLKYAFQTPILGFFLHLCAVIAVSQSKFLAKATENTSLVSGGVNTAAQFAYNSLSSVLLLVCLMAGLEVAKELGTFGASSITGLVEKGTHLVGVKPIEMLGEMGYQKAQRLKREMTAGLYEKAHFQDQNAGKKFGWSNVLDKDFAWRTKLTGWAVSALNPDAAYKARHKEFEELNEEEKLNAEKAAEDMVVVDRSRGTQWHEIRKSEQEKQERAFVDHFKTKSAGELMDLAHGFVDSGYINETRGKQEMRALITAAYQTGKIRDIVEDWTGQGEFTEEAQDYFFRDALKGDHEMKRFRDSMNDISKEKKLGYGVGQHLLNEEEYDKAYAPIIPHFERLRDLAREDQALAIADTDPTLVKDEPEEEEARKKLIADRRTVIAGEKDKINETIEQLKGAKEYKDHHKKAMAARRRRQARQIRHWGATDLPAVNPTGIDRVDEDGNVSEPLKMYIKRMDKYNSVPLNQRSMEYFAGVKIDQKTGAFVFKTPEQKKVWDFVLANHPSFAKRIYNAARGITYAGHPKYKDIPAEGVPYYVRHTVTQNVNGKVKEIDKYMKPQPDGSYAELSGAELAELEKNIRTMGTRLDEDKTGKGSQSGGKPEDKNQSIDATEDLGNMK
ncbi:MAG: Uncharacterized protein G01um101477_339, partial [Candidatus Doudnabacteria bacterium Gr01-1014_77]